MLKICPDDSFFHTRTKGHFFRDDEYYIFSINKL